MVAWLSWLFGGEPGKDAPSSDPADELRVLKARRRRLIDHLCSLRAYGFDTIAQDDEADLKLIERKIVALQLRTDPTDPSLP